MRTRVLERHWSKRVFLGVLALVLGAIFPAPTGAQSAVRHTLTWDASMEAAEYRVERNFVFVGSTTQLTFPVSILPGETVTFGVRSFGWCQDIITGAVLRLRGAAEYSSRLHGAGRGGIVALGDIIGGRGDLSGRHGLFRDRRGAECVDAR